MRILGSSLLAVALAGRVVDAALPLPSPPFLPPQASAGSQPSPARIPNAQWSTLLGNLLYFYEAQRSGPLPSTNRVPWRNSSGLNDGSDLGIDLTGGYYDAGDYIKCTFPLSFTLASICWGAMDFGTGYDLAKQTPYLDDMLRWGLGWLIKAHPNDNTLIIQVGDADIDNNYWGGDQTLPTPRPSLQINATSHGTDAAASAAAAFASCSALYSSTIPLSKGSKPAALQDTAFANTLLGHATKLFSFATAQPFVHYQDSVPTVNDTYASTGYEDDIVWASLFVSLAENSSSGFETAKSYYNSLSLNVSDSYLSWDDKTPALAVLFTQLLTFRSDFAKGTQGELNTWKSRAETYFDRILQLKSRSSLTKGGLIWYPGPLESPPASVNPAVNLAMLLYRYAPMATSQEKGDAYIAYAKKQLDYVLGKNPMHVPYIVGSNPNSPSNPHSAQASGGTDVNDIDNNPPVELHILYGGVVGGPDEHDNFYDLRSDWAQSEVALDYNAPVLTLAAMGVTNFADDPYFTALQPGAYSAVKPSGAPCDPAFPCTGRGKRHDL
ncbi:glycoside hydrolase family 9 protein [Botryobasidium botryosum FD-172 SS1]|uniref:Endoglucanase n=1 Tax=Botryobasidium botryosum (strain FD-172 SS1) TaxID=930990 RepID=A0A067LTL4_BOTB1|nr:glycoside hydrolase family 9 protein [Botryobasidium botryosum FD-172 SS1]